jgi:hypothetical protein
MLELIEKPRLSQACRARPLLARAVASYRRAAEIVCEATGADLRAVLSRRRRRGLTADARRLTVYIAVTAFNMSRRQCAKLTGRDRREIDRYCETVEANRERADFDQAIAAIEARLAGDPARGPIAALALTRAGTEADRAESARGRYAAELATRPEKLREGWREAQRRARRRRESVA